MLHRYSICVYVTEYVSLITASALVRLVKARLYKSLRAREPLGCSFKSY